MELPVCVFKSLEYLNIYANYTTLKAEVMSSRWIEKLRVVKNKPNNQIIKETSANNLNAINPLKWRCSH